jgi:DNA-directed RNA polymerase subunit RPC12/RpoP
MPETTPEKLEHVICMRFGKSVTIRPGATLEACHKCRHKISVSPTTRDMMEKHGFNKFTCLECAKELGLIEELIKDPSVLVTSEDQKKELNSFFKGVQNN